MKSIKSIIHQVTNMWFIFLMAIVFCHHVVLADSTSTSTSKDPIFENIDNWLNLLSPQNPGSCDNNPFTPETVNSTAQFSINSGNPLSLADQRSLNQDKAERSKNCAPTQLSLFCRASNKAIQSSLGEFNTACNSIGFTGGLGNCADRFRKCLAKNSKSVEAACSKATTKTSCTEIISSGKACAYAGATTQTSQKAEVDALNEEIRSFEDKISDNNKTVTDLNKSNSENTLSLQFIPTQTKTSVQEITQQAEQAIQKVDSELAKKIDDLQEQIATINGENIKLVAQLRTEEIQAAQDVSKTTAECKASAAKMFNELQVSRRNSVNSGTKASGLGSVLGGNRRFMKIKDSLEKDCLESDTYLEAIKSIQAKKQVAVDTLKETQKMISSKIDRIQGLIRMAQKEVSDQKASLLKAKDLALEKLQNEMAQKSQMIQAELNQNAQTLKTLQSDIDDQKARIDEKTKERAGAQCLLACLPEGGTSGTETPYAKAKRLFGEAERACDTVQDVADKATKKMCPPLAGNLTVEDGTPCGDKTPVATPAGGTTSQDVLKPSGDSSTPSSTTPVTYSEPFLAKEVSELTSLCSATAITCKITKSTSAPNPAVPNVNKSGTDQ